MVAEAHDTVVMFALGFVEAPVGMGALVAVHEVPDRVSSSPCALPEESKYPPPATHMVADGQDTEARFMLKFASPPTGTGALVAVQEVPFQVSTSAF
jgi:hypothetical protein